MTNETDWSVWCLAQELTKRAEDMGIKWGLEVINRYESNVCNTGLRVRNTPSCMLTCALPAMLCTTLNQKS